MSFIDKNGNPIQTKMNVLIVGLDGSEGVFINRQLVHIFTPNALLERPRPGTGTVAQVGR